MKSFLFTKLSGAGNDFILFDEKINPGIYLTAEIINNISKRRTGIGADGVIVISDSIDFDFDADYYNSDGSTGSLCANGARCAIKYAYESGRISKNLTNFKVNGVKYSGEVLNGGNIKFYLNPPSKLKYNFKIKAGGQLINSSYADTGSPHVIIHRKDILKDRAKNLVYESLTEIPVYELGKEIRYSKDFAPEGTNVNFIDLLDDTIYIRTYERGVEDETLACGTGSVASAIISYVNYGLKPPIKLIPKSGDLLFVDFVFNNNVFSDLSITGPAKIIFKGELSI